ncbi:MAG TPA: glycosyltransferase, partial [Armatimonadota bacterium]
MRIGLDARPTQGRFTGDATYWRGLIEGLSRIEVEDGIILYFDPKLPDPQMKLEKEFASRNVSAANWRLWSLVSFPSALKKDCADLGHVQYSLPPTMPCPIVTTIHDVSFKRHPQFFTWKDRTILDSAVKRANKKAARILTVSEFQKREMMELYGIAPEKIAV